MKGQSTVTKKNVALKRPLYITQAWLERHRACGQHRIIFRRAFKNKPLKVTQENIVIAFSFGLGVKWAVGQYLTSDRARQRFFQAMSEAAQGYKVMTDYIQANPFLTEAIKYSSMNGAESTYRHTQAQIVIRYIEAERARRRAKRAK